jgi:oligosaccharide repeat unit polymerase
MAQILLVRGHNADRKKGPLLLLNCRPAKMNAYATQTEAVRISWPLPLTGILAVFAFVLAAVVWFGLGDPNLIPGLFNQPWNNSLASIAAGGTIFLLLFIPIVWMVVSRKANFAAIWIMQNGLLAGGYFFLPETAYALNLPEVAINILNTGSSIVIINAVGFMVLLVSLGLTNLFARLTRASVNPLPKPPEIYDWRLMILLRAAAAVGVVIVAAAMAVSHTIPMLASDPEAARYAFTQNSITRPLFNLNMAIMPFVGGGLMVLFFRKPSRHAGMDGILGGALIAMQLLSGDRFPLSVATMVFIALMSMEKKWPRWLLFVSVVTYFFLFVGLSGLSSMWRQNRDAMSANEGLLAASFRQAYTGDNLIDYRDGSWVLGQWDKQPLLGITYLGGLTEMMPSAIFPQKKQWHMGKVALRIVGWDIHDDHYGLRLSSFAESFLNFGFAGVIGMGIVFGIVLGTLSRHLTLLSNGEHLPCVARNLSALILTQMMLIWANTSDAFMFWALLALLLIMKIFVFRARGLARFIDNWRRD